MHALSTITAVTLALPLACTTTDADPCGPPGEARACACVGGEAGLQSCGADGAWAACQCAPAPDAVADTADDATDDATTPPPDTGPDAPETIVPVPGCVDMDAANYLPTATVDDGSCTYTVTFAVDMSELPTHEGDIVFVSGDFSEALGDPAWCVDCNPMTASADSIFRAAVTLPAGRYHYAFHVNAGAVTEEIPEACGVREDDTTRRELVLVDEPLDLAPVRFGECPCTAATCAGIDTCVEGRCVNRFQGLYSPGVFTIETALGTCQNKVGILVDALGGLRLFGVDPTSGEPDPNFFLVECVAALSGADLPLRIEVRMNGASSVSAPNHFDRPLRLLFSHAGATAELDQTLTGTIADGTFTGELPDLPKTVGVGLDLEVQRMSVTTPTP